MSSFQLRTFDPEGAIFYGDTKKGADWFVLSLKDGIPLVQICKGDIHISVAGGTRLNDGKWHTVSDTHSDNVFVKEVILHRKQVKFVVNLIRNGFLDITIMVRYTVVFQTGDHVLQRRNC